MRLDHVSKANVESLGLGLGLAPRIRVANLANSAKDCDGTNVLDTNDPNISGGDIEEATPDPIPNSEVKLFGADGTAREAVWESRTLPGFFLEEPA